MLNAIGQNTDPLYTTQYALVNSSGVIIQIASSPTFSAQPVGTYQVHVFNYLTSAGISGLSVGANVSSVTSSCYESDNISVVVCPVDCDYTDSDVVILTATGGNSSADYTTQYVLTNLSGIILQIQSTPNFGNLSNGSYKVFAINYRTAAGITGLTVGLSIYNVASSCMNISSDFIRICSALGVDGTYNESINCIDQEFLLKWSLPKETNVDFIRIIKSVDAINWEELTQINTVYGQNDYQFIDNNISNSYEVLYKFFAYDNLSVLAESNVFYANRELCLKWGLYPNPGNDYVILTAPKNIDLTQLEFFDAVGKKVSVQSSFFNNSKNEIIINTADLQSGGYYLRYENECFYWIKIRQ